MTITEILDVFDWLEKEMNKRNLFYFMLEINAVDDFVIGAYFKSDNSLFCTFNVRDVKYAIKEFGRDVKNKG